MLIIAFGANLPADVRLRERRFCSALAALERSGIRMLRASRLYLTPPLRPRRLVSCEPHSPPPAAGANYYLNACILARCAKPAAAVLARLKAVEAELGRSNTPARWEDRVIDLDLIDCRQLILTNQVVTRKRLKLTLPHPAAHTRLFVLLPLMDVAPWWHHPSSRLSVRQHLAHLTRLTRLGHGEGGAVRLLPSTYWQAHTR